MLWRCHVTTGSKGRRSLASLAGLLVAAWSAGCTARHDQYVAFVHSHEAQVSTGEYVVRPPDAVAIHAPGIEELDGSTTQVRPDGKIVLRLLGDVDVAGLTTEEIAAKLEALLKRYYVDPEVLVEIASYRSQFYYVFGEVTTGGPRPFTGRDTLLKALAEAQPTFLAWRAQIKVVRPAADPNQTRTIVVDLDRMVQGGDTSQDILLQEGDVIQVPPTPLAWVGNTFRELLYPVGPVLEAYDAPTQPLITTHVYESELGSGNKGNRRRGR